ALVQFQHITITGGSAVDNGTASATPGTRDAKGGGILNFDPVNNSGGNLAFSSAVVRSNHATGGNGANAAVPGGAGGPGFNAMGGGLYSQSGTVTITGSTFSKNLVLGGNGGAGSAGANGGATGQAGGAGGTGGEAQGGGLWVQTGNVTLD